MTRKLMIFVLLIPLVLSGLVVAQDETIVEFPALTGEYQVGRATYHMIDEGREEIFTPGNDDVRELMVTVYYPASPGPEDQPAPYVEGAQREALSTGTRIVPPLPWDQISTHMYADAAVNSAETNYPVLLFSPGFFTNPVFYTSILEDISSHGYIVVALAHPYSVDAVTFPDRRIIGINTNGTPAVGKVWVQDALFVLDQLTQLNLSDGVLASHLDLSRVGMFGHSFGGAASVEAAYQDERIHAAINIDGLMFGDVLRDGIDRPFMMMLSDSTWQQTSEERSEISESQWRLIQQQFSSQIEPLVESSPYGYVWTLIGSAHNTFTDGPILEPLASDDMPQFDSGWLGIIDAQRAHEVTCTYILAFFDKHVKDEDVALLDGPSADYPEVVFEVYGG